MKRLIVFIVALCALCLMLAACGDKESEPATATEAATEHPISFATEEGELPIMGGGSAHADASEAGEETNTPAPATSAPTEAPAPAATSAPAASAPAASAPSTDAPTELSPEIPSFFSGEEYELPFVPSN